MKFEDINLEFFQKMNMKFEKILNCEYIINIINKMIEMIYELKRKKWEIEFEFDLCWNIIDYKFWKEKLILNGFEISKRGKKVNIDLLKLRLNLEEYIIYKIELCINFKN